MISIVIQLQIVYHSVDQPKPPMVDIHCGLPQLISSITVKKVLHILILTYEGLSDTNDFIVTSVSLY